MGRMDAALDNIKKLVGNVEPGQLRYVDSFVAGPVGLFMPVGGECYYALSQHSHPSYMFVLSFDEQTRIMLGEKIIAARHGEILSISPGIFHRELPADCPPRYVAIYMEKEFFGDQLRRYPVGDEVVFAGESHGAGPELLPLLRKFMVEADGDVPGADAILYALGLEVCHSIIRSIFDFSPRHDRVSSRLEIDRTIEYLHKHLDRKITVDDMAVVADMSLSHFSRIFMEQMGRPPAQYLGRIRLERAKKFLLAGEKSVTEVALECGFGSPAYLSERFLRKYGVTPTAYRKSMISDKKGRMSKDRAGQAVL